jgi:hypothetical protein
MPKLRMNFSRKDERRRRRRRTVDTTIGITTEVDVTQTTRSLTIGIIMNQGTTI